MFHFFVIITELCAHYSSLFVKKYCRTYETKAKTLSTVLFYDGHNIILELSTRVDIQFTYNFFLLEELLFYLKPIVPWAKIYFLSQSDIHWQLRLRLLCVCSKGNNNIPVKWFTSKQAYAKYRALKRSLSHHTKYYPKIIYVSLYEVNRFHKIL